MSLQTTPSKKKRRHRPHTKGIRMELKTNLEQAILQPGSELLADFNVKNDGFLGAPLWPVLEKLKRIYFPQLNLEQLKGLSTLALKSVSNITRVFRVVEFGSGQGNAALWILVDPSVLANAEEKTVYVDNIPPHCSEQRLRRRAEIFGTVVGINLPLIRRIMCHFAHGSSNPVLNSGFGFIQFASKTAAKRFCKRYAPNSRSIARRHGQKKKSRMADASITRESEPCEGEQTAENSRKTSQEDSMNQLTKEDTALEQQQSLDTTKPKENDEELLSPDKGQKMDYLANEFKQPPLVRHHWPNTMTLAHRQRTQSFSQTTSSQVSVDDSGTETDVPDIKKQKTEQSDQTKKKRKRRPHRQRKSGPESGNLTNLLKRIQVFPLKQYRELRAEYFRLKKERMQQLKQELRLIETNLDAEIGVTSSTLSASKLEIRDSNISATSSLDQGPSCKQSRQQKKRRRTRGRTRLLSRAYQMAKMLASIDQQGNHFNDNDAEMEEEEGTGDGGVSQMFGEDEDTVMNYSFDEYYWEDSTHLVNGNGGEFNHHHENLELHDGDEGESHQGQE